MVGLSMAQLSAGQSIDEILGLLELAVTDALKKGTGMPKH